MYVQTCPIHVRTCMYRHAPLQYHTCTVVCALPSTHQHSHFVSLAGQQLAQALDNGGLPSPWWTGEPNSERRLQLAQLSLLAAVGEDLGQ